MADDRSASFEGSLQRLEQIVKTLEGEEPDLERAVLLYKEGRELVERCQGLLKNAQQAIDAVNAPPAAARSAEDASDDGAEEIPF
jgi:exodeoxyribonuclease VII small subunit